MSLLSKIHHGKQPLPPRLTLYGWEGTGKSTCGNGAPSPVFIDGEGGLTEINCARFPRVKRGQDVMDALAELHTGDHAFQTVVLDTADALERVFQADVCQRYGVNTIEKAGGGYGKGYVEAALLFEKMLAALDVLRLERRMVVIVIAHAKVEKFYDPEAGEYDRYSPRLHKTTSALLKEWSDAVLFATRKMRVEREGDRAQAKPIGHGGGERVLKTEGGPACVAKNRYQMPPEIPLSWSAIYAAIATAQRTDATAPVTVAPQPAPAPHPDTSAPVAHEE